MIPQVLQIANIIAGEITSLPNGSNGSEAGNESNKGAFAKLLQKIAEVGENDTQETSGNKKQVKSDWTALLRDCLNSGNISKGKNALPAKLKSVLKKLLMSDGISEKDVNNFIEKLFEGGNKKEILVSELMEKIKAFRREKDEKEDDVSFEMSVLPQLENILRSLGIEKEEIEKIMDDSFGNNGSVYIEKLINELKKLQNDSSRKLVINDQDENTEKIKSLLEKIGLQKEASQIKGGVTLQEFIRILESKVENQRQGLKLSEEAINNEVKTLVENLKKISKEENYKGKAAKNHIDGFEKFAFQDGNKNGQKVSHEKTKIGNLEKNDYKTNTDLSSFEKTMSHKKEEVITKVEDLVDAVKKGNVQSLDSRNDTGNFHGDINREMDNIGRQIQADGSQKENPRLVPFHVVNQVGKKLGLALKRGESRVQVQLKPPHLGHIELNMAMKNNVLKLSIVSEHPAVKELMVSHVHELRDALVDQGIELHKVDVQIEYNFGQSMADAYKDRTNAKMWKRHWTQQSGKEQEAAIPVEAAKTRIGTDGALDMFA